ncbi:MAG: HAD family hydrolase [Clostridia bacterium]|nr:HAD family hydrolase [Clostridia bacterium]
MNRLCVFDLDGTLVDSVTDIADAINRSLRKLGKQEHPVDAYYKMVGNGMEMLCRRALPDGTEEEVLELIQLYKEDYLRNCCVKTMVYPGMKALLRVLQERGIKLAILSNKPQEQTEVILDTLFSNEIFEEVIGAGPRYPRKPDPSALIDIMDTLGFEAEDVFYIGDSDVDMNLACNTGVSGIGVAWGFRGRAELENAGACYVADTADELLAYILREETK